MSVSLTKLTASQLCKLTADLTHERDELQRKVEALAVENAALKSGSDLFFSYGSEHSFDLHKSAKEAIESAEGAIDDYRGDACDGWSEEVDSVCWGVVLQKSTKVGERPRTGDDCCDPAIEVICDYALLPGIETPATDAALAEIRAQGVDKFVNKISSELRSAGGGDGYHTNFYPEFADHLESKGSDFSSELRKEPGQ